MRGWQLLVDAVLATPCLVPVSRKGISERFPARPVFGRGAKGFSAMREPEIIVALTANKKPEEKKKSPPGKAKDAAD